MPMLGMYLALYGNNSYQVEYMHKKTTAWSTYIRAGGVQQNEAWKDLNFTITQTMKCPLTAMILNEK